MPSGFLSFQTRTFIHLHPFPVMDVQQRCQLCPRRLHQSGKRCADSFTVTKTPCPHYFHPACWERHYKRTKTSSDPSCPCPTCNRIVTRDGLTDITVPRDKNLPEKPLQENGQANHLRSAVEEARLQRAAAELEKRSKQQKAGQVTPKKVRPQRNAHQPHRAPSSSIPAQVIFSRVMKPVGKVLLVLALLGLLGKCYWDHIAIEPLTNWDDVMTDQVNDFSQMREIIKRTRMLNNMTPAEKETYVNEQGLNADQEFRQNYLEFEILDHRMLNRENEKRRLEKSGKNQWKSGLKAAAYLQKASMV